MMANRIMARATPSVLRWARESAGLAIEQAASRVGVDADKLSAAERGEKPLTFSQLKEAAGAYKRPLAIFFLPQPPQTVPTGPDFRRVPEALGASMSPSLRFEIRRLQRKREIAERLGSSEDFDWSFVGSLTLETKVDEASALVRKLLAVTPEIRRTWKDDHAVFRWWRTAVEDTGVLVFLSRRIPIDEMRGCSIALLPFPVIAVNRGDLPRPRTFTLLHEFTHVLLGVPGVCDLDELDYHNELTRKQTEVFCNAVAAEVLVPRIDLLESDIVRRHRAGPPWSVENELRPLAAHFGASIEVVLRRLLTLGLAHQDEYSTYRTRSQRELAERRASDDDGGPNERGFEIVMRTQPSSYVRLVLDAMHRDQVTAADVADYLDMKLDHLDALERALFDTEKQNAR